ncbi:MAG: transglutaminase domain-containing protein, partial [Anaerolineaceae bacterium]
MQPCPATDPNTPCSLWPYHIGYGMAQAYWTEQFTKSAFVNHAIKAIHGKNTLAAAVPAIASWTDVEFYTHAGTYQNNWSSSIYRYFDGTGFTMAGGDCESTATTFTTLLRSAGIPAKTFAVDYVQTAGHGDPTWLLTQNFEYDHATMMWINGQWYAQRAYGADELTVDPYYPFNSTPTALQTWSTVGRSGGTWYYNDNYGDVLVSVNEDWDFQNGSNGGGTVNTVWPVTTQEFSSVNRDYQWDSKEPLKIMQSPDVEVFNFPNWLGDNWANTEWRTPVVSNPASPARDETLTYVLPVGVPDP